MGAHHFIHSLCGGQKSKVYFDSDENTICTVKRGELICVLQSYFIL